MTDASESNFTNGSAGVQDHQGEATHQNTLDPQTLHVLVKDAIIQLVSCSTGRTMKCDLTNKAAPSLSVNGREEDESSFKVHITGQLGVICLENVAHEDRFVHCSDDSFTVAQGEATEVRNKLIIGQTDEGFLQFESYLHRGSYITAHAKTKRLLPIVDSRDGSNHDTHFILRPKYLPGMIQTLPSPAKNYDPRTVTPHVAVAFVDGNCICMKSRASGRHLAVSASGNMVTGVGSPTDENSKFYVRTTIEGSVLLQSALGVRKYLSISDDGLNCNGNGGRNSNFNLIDHHEDLISLESVMFPGSYVGIGRNGVSTDPSKTKNTDPEAQFYFTIIQLANSRALLAARSTKKKSNTRSLYAGPSIMSKFRAGSLIQLISVITKQPVWAVDDVVQASTQGFLGLGGLPVVKNDARKLIDQFYVQVRRPGVIALQSAKNPKSFLSIKKGIVSANGDGDAYCNFTVTEDDNGFVTLESELYLDQFLGFTATGDALSPHKVHPDSFCGKFLVRVMNFTGTLYPIPSVAANVDSSQVSPIVQVAFQDLVKIHLRPKSFFSADTNLRVMDDASIDCAGKDGDPYATFIVHSHSEIPGAISLQNAKNTFNWLAIREGKFIGDGDPTDEAMFKLLDKSGGLVSFESLASSAKCRHCYIAVKANGTAGNAKASGFHMFSDETVFQVRIAQLPKFYDGAKIILFSKEFKKAIRVMPNGDVNCLGGHGMKAQFFVHGRRLGVVALQNAMFPDKWLSMHDGKVAVGPGDKESEFKFHEKDNFVSFESVAYPGCYLGVLANGQLKKPDKVSTPDNYDLFDIKNAER